MIAYYKLNLRPVDIKSKDLAFAKVLVNALGGPSGELAASMRYFNQAPGMPTDKGKALLIDIATEELMHVEMLYSMLNQILKNATIDEIKASGLEQSYSLHKDMFYPTDSNGIPFSASSYQVTGDPIADLYEDMAAEQKARAAYERLMDLTDDKSILNVLFFLRQREIVHFACFKKLKDSYEL